MSQIFSADLAAWCLRNGYTHPSYHHGQWWAIAPHAVMPTPLPYLAKGINPPSPNCRLQINLTQGTLFYYLSDRAITAAQWVPSRQFCFAYPNTAIVLGLDCLEIDEGTVMFRCHPDRSFLVPTDWEAQPNNTKGLLVKATVHSFYYFAEEEAA